MSLFHWYWCCTHLRRDFLGALNKRAHHKGWPHNKNMHLAFSNRDSVVRKEWRKTDRTKEINQKETMFCNGFLCSLFVSPVMSASVKNTNTNKCRWSRNDRAECTIFCLIEESNKRTREKEKAEQSDRTRRAREEMKEGKEEAAPLDRVLATSEKGLHRIAAWLMNRIWAFVCN